MTRWQRFWAFMPIVCWMTAHILFIPFLMTMNALALFPVIPIVALLTLPMAIYEWRVSIRAYRVQAAARVDQAAQESLDHAYTAYFHATKAWAAGDIPLAMYEKAKETYRVRQALAVRHVARVQRDCYESEPHAPRD